MCTIFIVQSSTALWNSSRWPLLLRRKQGLIRTWRTVSTNRRCGISLRTPSIATAWWDGSAYARAIASRSTETPVREARKNLTIICESNLFGMHLNVCTCHRTNSLTSHHGNCWRHGSCNLNISCFTNKIPKRSSAKRNLHYCFVVIQLYTVVVHVFL